MWQNEDDCDAEAVPGGGVGCVGSVRSEKRKEVIPSRLGDVTSEHYDWRAYRHRRDMEQLVIAFRAAGKETGPCCYDMKRSGH